MGPLRYSDLGRRPAPDGGGGAGWGAVADWLVDAVDRWWAADGRPDPYTLVVVSADEGTLARRVLELGPECLDALRYVMVDPGRDGLGPPAGLSALVAMDEPSFLFPSGPAPAGPDEDPDDALPPAQDVGPLLTWLAAIPVLGDDRLAAGRPAGMLVAVGELGRLPYDLFQWDGGCWSEVRLAAADSPAGTEGEGLVEMTVPVDPESRPGGARRPPPARHLPPDPAPGRYPVLVGAVEWLQRALGSVALRTVVVVDSIAEAVTPEPATPEGPPPGPVTGRLDLEQLCLVRRPEAGPEPVGDSLQAVTWRVG